MNGRRRPFLHQSINRAAGDRPGFLAPARPGQQFYSHRPFSFPSFKVPTASATAAAAAVRHRMAACWPEVKQAHRGTRQRAQKRHVSDADALEQKDGRTDGQKRCDGRSGKKPVLARTAYLLHESMSVRESETIIVLGDFGRANRRPTDTLRPFRPPTDRPSASASAPAKDQTI